MKIATRNRISIGGLQALLCLLLLIICGCERVQLQPLTADATILAFGDSLTYGTGAKRTESYPVILSELTGRTVINAGNVNNTWPAMTSVTAGAAPL